MRLALCNEVLRELPFERQCTVAAELGYESLEIAPFTLSEEPHRLAAQRIVELRRAIANAGVTVSGLHWLLVCPEGLSITSPDTARRERTADVLFRLIELCAELGGGVLVHGSPRQRVVEDADTWEDAYARAREVFAEMARAAEGAGVVYCIEPLSRAETQFINTVAEAARLVDEIENPHFRTMIDTSAAGQVENEPVSDLIREWLPSGRIAHIQLNDTNRRAPGQGQDDFVAILRAIKDCDYRGVLAVEPFVYQPDGPTVAARAAGYLHGIWDALP